MFLENKSLFDATPMGPKFTTRRISGRAIEKMIEKYSKAFGKQIYPYINLDIRLLWEHQVKLKSMMYLSWEGQLGYSTIETTMIYTHIKNEDLRTAINKFNLPKE